MNIYGKKTVLRAIEKEDSSFICEIFNDPEIEQSVVGWAFPVSLLSQNKWFENHINDNSNQRYIVKSKNGENLGIATLTNIDWKNRCAVHGIKLLKDSRGKGIGTDVVMAIMRYAFDELGLHRIETTIIVENDASINLFKKCGWTIEGTKRSCVFKNGEWKDLLILGIIDTDYNTMMNNNNYWE